MASQKQMGADEGTPREGVTQQQQGGADAPVRREGDKKPATQMQGTQFTDWASI